MTKKDLRDVVVGVWFETFFALLVAAWVAGIFALIYLFYAMYAL